MAIEVSHLSYAYPDHPVLQDVSFSVSSGEFLSILGPNGVGKSTLFRCMLGLLSGYSGNICIDGADTRQFSVRQSARHMAYIPQSSRPLFHYSVLDIVLMGRSSCLSPLGVPGKQDTDRCRWALEKVGIGALSHRCYHRLSGGEQQLVLIARALVQDAPILMLDEPTASLDYGNQLRVLEQVRQLAREGYTVIQTTHNPELSYLYSDRILALHRGRVLAEGTPGQVLTQDTLRQLYQADVQVVSLFRDRARVCVPRNIVSQEDLP